MSDEKQRPTVAEMLTAPLENLSPEDRARLLAALLDKSSVRSLLLPDSFGVLLLAEDNVQPGERRAVMARCYLEGLLATHLLTLDLEREQADVQERVIRTTTTTTTGRWWWKRKAVKTDVETVRTTTSARIVKTPAAAWDVHEMYFGSKNVLRPLPPNSAAGLPLSAGLLEAPAFEPFVISSGIDLVMTVSHRLEGPASFRALLFARRMEAKPGARPPTRGTGFVE